MRLTGTLVLCVTALAAPGLRDQIASNRLDDLRWPDFSDFKDEVARFYEQRSYALAWSRNGAITPQAMEVIEVLKTCESRGLEPEDYDGSRWPARISRLDPIRFDIALTVSAMRYASDVHLGKFNPGIYHSKFDLRDKRHNFPDLLARLAEGHDARGLLNQLEPSLPIYLRTREMLQRYIALARINNESALAPTKAAIEPGAQYPDLPRLIARLRLLGDLSEATKDSQKHEEPVVSAVKRFQSRHGLLADGRIGKDTLAQLNVPTSRRVRQLQLSLERWRWMPHTFEQPPIVINIPEFELHGVNESYESALEMKVVVGTAYRRQTPVFMGEMKYVIFRPYWNVPPGITRHELVPKVVRDRQYLASNGYEVVTAEDRVVSSGAVDDSMLKIRRHDVKVWLVNTGWTGGPYGVGQRMKIAYTRAMVRAALAGELDQVETATDSVFGLAVPREVPGVPQDVLDPRGTWEDKAAYDSQASRLLEMFEANFAQFAPLVPEAVRVAMGKRARRSRR